MKGFFDKVGKDVQKALNNNSKTNYNRGGGKSLGGSKPGEVIPNIHIVESGPIGIKLENTSQNHAIIADVTHGGIAESVGLQRGDIICHPNSQGRNEIQYKEFLKMVKSKSRPIVFDVRRMVSNLSSLPSSVSSSSYNNNNRKPRADADARRQAVILAAEERDKKNKAKKRPIPKKKGGKVVAELTQDEMEKIALQKEENIKRNAIHMANKPLSQEAQMAVQAAKQDEAHHSNQLGYNPYETRKVTAGQAASASVAMTHGSMGGAGGGGSGSGSAGGATSSSSASTSAPTAPRRATNTTTIPTVRNPSEALIPAEEIMTKHVNESFDQAFHTVVTTNPDDRIPKSLRIMKKLILNATSSPPNDPKRQVRISEPNNLIQSCIIDINGAFDLMNSVGFILSEVDGKTFLVYNDGMNFNGDGDGGPPSWLNDALEKMDTYGSLGFTS